MSTPDSLGLCQRKEDKEEDGDIVFEAQCSRNHGGCHSAWGDILTGKWPAHLRQVKVALLVYTYNMGAAW